MKIAIYCHSIAPSIDGVCRRFTAMMATLLEMGHEVLLFTLEERPMELSAGLKHVVTLPHMCFPAYPEKKVARPNLQCMITIGNALAKYRPDIVHVTCDGVTQMFCLIGLLLGIPVVGSFHTDIIDLISTHNAHPFQKMCVLCKEYVDSIALDSAATTSRSFQVKLLTQGVATDFILKTAVDTEVFSPTKRSDELRKELTFGDPDAFLCVYVGRISKEKRIDTIWEAIASLDHVYLALIGDGPTANLWSQRHGRSNRIYCKPKFLSHSELAQIYASSDLHVSGSEFETLGNTVLEAFASKIPVVVPRTQGFCNTVTVPDPADPWKKAADAVDEPDGFLFEPGNSESARRYIKLLLDDKNLRIKYGENGRENVRLLTVENIVLDMLQWYERGAQKRKDRSAILTAMILVVLLGTIPFAIFALFCYDMITMIMVKVMGMQLDLGAPQPAAKKRD